MKGKDVLSKFIFIGNKVNTLKLETSHVDKKGLKADLSFDFDYNVKDVQQNEKKLFGIIEFIVIARAKVKRKILFKIELVMEGAFGIESSLLTEDKFLEMLEVNGLITLSQISRAYILSVTSQAGIPPVRVPMINILKLQEMKKQKENK